MRTYSDELKASLVERMLLPGTRLGPLSPSHSNHEIAAAGNGGAGWPLRRSASTCDK